MQYEVSIGFTSAEQQTKAVFFDVGDLVSDTTFSKSYLEDLINGGYLKEFVINQPEISVSDVREESLYQILTPTDKQEVLADINRHMEEPVQVFVTPKSEEPTEINPPIVEEAKKETVVIEEPKIVKDDIEVRIAGTYLMSVVAVGLFLVSGYLTVAGYASLFSVNKEIIISLLIMMEISKFSIATVVINQKVLGAYRYILSAFLVILVLLASIGHYGYLSSLHGVNESKNEVQDESLSYVNSRISMLTADKENLQRQYDAFDATSQATRKERLYKSIQPKIDDINEELAILFKEKSKLISNKATESHKETTAMNYTAKLLGMTVDQFAGLLISLLSIIIDPLVIILASLSSKMRHMRRNIIK